MYKHIVIFFGVSQCLSLKIQEIQLKNLPRVTSCRLAFFD